MVDLIAQHEPQELRLRDVSHRLRTGKELHRAGKVLDARRLERRHRVGVGLLERTYDFLPRVRGLRKSAAETKLILDRGREEALLDREGPDELPRAVGSRVWLELGLPRRESLPEIQWRVVILVG